MLLFTWNVAGKIEMLELALAHLHSSGQSFIATFQEAPLELDDVELAKRGWRVVRLAVLPRSSGRRARVIVYASSTVPLRAAPRVLSPHRTIAVQLVLEGRPVWIFAIHGLDLRNHPQQSVPRKSFTGNYRRLIREITGADCGIVVMGDLNANPYAPEILNGDGLWAVLDKRDLERRAKMLSGVTELIIAPFFNPMWRAIVEGPHGILGTYYYPTPGGGPSWHWVDQILVSADFAETVQNPIIHTSLQSRNLLKRTGTPGGSGASDHLPVEVSLAPSGGTP